MLSECPVRGIANATGTACHLNTAVIITRYCINPYIEENSNRDKVVEWILNAENKHAFREVVRVQDALFRSTGLQAEDVGDAVTGLIKILHHVGAKEQSLQNVVYSGRAHSVLSGECRDGDIRTKRLKERSLPNPYPLQLHGDDSLVSCLREAFCESHVVRNYKWERESLVSDDWKTSKRLHVTCFPPVLMIHLERFSATEKNKVTPNKGSGPEIPAELNIKDFTHDCQIHGSRGTEFELVGGILHVSEDDDKGNKEEDYGHYVAVVKVNKQWYLVNDDHVSQVSVDRVLSWMEGHVCPTGLEGVSSSKVHLRGVLLVYKQSDLQTCKEKESSCSKSNSMSTIASTVSITPLESQVETENCVGRRVFVRWKNGAFYAGVVSAYNPCNEKHSVTYEDGDVRHYTLSQKTIHWADMNAETDRLSQMKVGKRLLVKQGKYKYKAGTLSTCNLDSGDHEVLYDDGSITELDHTEMCFEWIV